MWTLPASGITAIFGVSGAGKTSLINAISGLTHPQSGQIALNDRLLFDRDSGINLPPEKRRIGYVFQDARLFPHYRVRGNLRYGMAPKMKAQFGALVTLLGLDALLDRYPASLSGGEKQRVAMGRALLTAPDLLLLDEPLASLDLPRKRELLPYLQRLAKQVKIPLLYVSHSLDEILQLANQVLVLDNGNVKAFGALEKVWGSSAMRPWLPAAERSSVLRVQRAGAPSALRDDRAGAGRSAHLGQPGESAGEKRTAHPYRLGGRVAGAAAAAKHLDPQYFTGAGGGAAGAGRTGRSEAAHRRQRAVGAHFTVGARRAEYPARSVAVCADQERVDYRVTQTGRQRGTSGLRISAFFRAFFRST